MKVAVLGCGGMGRVHASAYASLSGVELVGVCDRDQKLAEELAGKVNTRAFYSFEEMMEAVQPDAVSLTLPSHLHKEYAVKTARLGKHVICEKPIALTIEDARAVVQACEEHGVRLFTGHVVRFFPDYAQVKEIYDAGGIGRAGVAHLKRVGSHPGIARPWFKVEEESGGVIVDLMIHDIDFVLWVFGDVKSVYALRRCDGDSDYAWITLVFKNGAIANLEGHWGYPGSFRTAFEFAGSNGLIRGDSESAQSLKIRKNQEKLEGARFAEVPGSPLIHDPYFTELEHFISCIRDNREALVTPADACKALEIANAARESALTGKVIWFD